MATCRATINGALRKISVLAAGREARAVDAEDALEALKGMYRSWISSGAFGRLRDVIPLADYTACENERIFIESDQSIQITLPLTVPNWIDWYGGYPGDGCCDGWGPYPSPNQPDRNSRPPRDCAVVVICNGFTGIMSDFIYDGSIKQWVAVNGTIDGGTVQPLTLDAEAPLSVRDPQGLQAALAFFICDQFGGDMPALTLRQAQVYQTGLINRYSGPRQEAASCGSYF